MSEPRAVILEGDCLDVLARIGENTVDGVLTDPPYGLSKEPDITEVMRKWLEGKAYEHGSNGFMGRSWDSFVPGPEYWRAVYRVLKPGGHALVFAGTRTQDLMTVALRFAGFEVRDVVDYIYGSGFPKSLDVSKAIDKSAGLEREVIGTTSRRVGPQGSRAVAGLVGSSTFRENPDNPGNLLTAPASAASAAWAGYGTALKPAREPIIIVRKPLEGTVAANVLKWGTGALNIDGCRVGSEKRFNPPTHKGTTSAMGDFSMCSGSVAEGRWPANLILDEEAAALLDAQSGELSYNKGGVLAENQPGGIGVIALGGGTKPTRSVFGFGDRGGASRFFYCAKTSRKERSAGLPARVDDKPANFHPTVKPIRLMRYLARLLGARPGFVLLDPFLGSDSTAVAGLLEGAHVCGIEREPEYVEIARGRVAAFEDLREDTEPNARKGAADGE